MLYLDKVFAETSKDFLEEIYQKECEIQIKLVNRSLKLDVEGEHPPFQSLQKGERISIHNTTDAAVLMNHINIV